MHCSKKTRSVDHLVGATKYAEREGEPKRLGGLHIDHQLDFRRLLHRQVGRLLTFENPADVDTGQTVLLRITASVLIRPPAAGP